MDKYLNIDHPHPRFPKDSRLNRLTSPSRSRSTLSMLSILVHHLFFGHLFGTPLMAISVIPTVFCFIQILSHLFVVHLWSSSFCCTGACEPFRVRELM